MRQRGEIDWILLLFFLLLLKAWQFQFFYRSAHAWADAYQSLEENLQASQGSEDWQEEFEAFATEWQSPPPRIDYGSTHQNKTDAEALCIVGRKILSNEDFQKFSCN